MSERAAPFHCPYCGDEDLRPSAEGGHGAWECASCRRAFQLKFLGLLSPANGPAGGPAKSASPANGGNRDDQHG